MGPDCPSGIATQTYFAKGDNMSRNAKWGLAPFCKAERSEMKISALHRVGRRARHPFIGLATVLGAVIVFLLFLVGITALVHWIIM